MTKESLEDRIKRLRVELLLLEYDEHGDPICACGEPGYACRCCNGCGNPYRYCECDVPYEQA